VMNPPAGPVPTWTSNDQVWIRAPLAAAPFWRLNQVADAAAVDTMTEPPHPDQDADQFWAWIDQQAGTVRARVFAVRYGVPQDEACGSASMLLAGHLGRAITIQHGRGSLVQASPAPNGMADLGWPRRLGPRACRRLASTRHMRLERGVDRIELDGPFARARRAGRAPRASRTSGGSATSCRSGAVDLPRPWSSGGTTTSFLEW
jgi:hypothetical protein